MSAEEKKEADANMLSAMIAAFEFGYRCCEKGMNLQAALAHFQTTVKTDPKKN
jgi:hypothetical protein